MARSSPSRLCSSSGALVRAGALLTLASACVKAAVTPTYPGPGITFDEGSDCTIKWTLDKTANTEWNNFDIDLMTGSNLAMVNVTRVASALDGTTGTGVYTYPCPNVTPNSAIYFYQMTVGGLEPTWTTRFTIANSTGGTTKPQHATQDGSAIPWGTGKLTGTQPAAVSSAVPSATSSAVDDSATATATTDADTATATSADASSSAAPAATSTAAASHSSSTGLFSTLKPTFRYIIYAAIGVLGVLIIGLVTWGLCLCCKRRKLKRTDKNYVPKKIITHNVPSSRGGSSPPGSAGEGKWGNMADTSIDTWVEPPSPYEEKYRGADERWEMAPTGAPSHEGRTPPPGWTAPAQYDYASHSAISFADDTPLVKALTRAPTQRNDSRPGVQRNPSSHDSRPAMSRNASNASSHAANQRNRYTQQQVDGYGQDQGGYEREQRAAWNSLPQRQPQNNWI